MVDGKKQRLVTRRAVLASTLAGSTTALAGCGFLSTNEDDETTTPEPTAAETLVVPEDGTATVTPTATSPPEPAPTSTRTAIETPMKTTDPTTTPTKTASPTPTSRSSSSSEPTTAESISQRSYRTTTRDSGLSFPVTVSTPRRSGSSPSNHPRYPIPNCSPSEAVPTPGTTESRINA
mgnify:CR=1 FL=1